MGDRSPAAWSLAALALFGVVGCSDDGNPGGAGAGASGAGGAAASSWITSECGTCVQTECAMQIQSCQSDPGCSAYWSCVTECPRNAVNENADSDCEAACVSSASSESTDLRAKMEDCRFRRDGASECPACGVVPTTWSESGQNCQEFVPPPRIVDPTLCQDCFFEECCETWAAANGDAGANAIVDCFGTCSDSACLDACFAANEGSTQIFLDQHACGRVYCAADQDDCIAANRNACEACAKETCADTWEAVLLDRDAWLLWWCPVFDCADGDGSVECIEDCFDTYPAGEEKNLLWLECIQAQCPECD